MRRWLVAAAAALPVLGTLATIAANEAGLRGATEWRIPITGYDPRDPLRGRYLAFSYVWQANGDPAACRKGNCTLCLADGGRSVTIAAPAASCAAAVDVTASGLSVAPTFGRPGQIAAASRLWVSEARAPTLERQLRSRPMVAVARLTRGGRLLAERVEPAE